MGERHRSLKQPALRRAVFGHASQLAALRSVVAREVLGPWRRVAFVAAAFAFCGCDRSPPASQPAPASAPSSQPTASAPAAPAVVETDPILPESRSWSRETCLEKLAALSSRQIPQASSEESVDTDFGAVSAAVRLVRLAGQEPLCVPAEMAARDARRLRVVQVAEGRWCLGRVDRDERVLSAPVLIDQAGELLTLLEGMEEELAFLHVSSDAEVFPHVVITPVRVLIIGAEVTPAIVARELPRARFTLERKGEYPFVALTLALPAAASQPATAASQPATAASRAIETGEVARRPQPIEVARFTWDPYESAFQGPASDLLPDPPGGTFEIDLSASKAFVPVGGRLAEPKPHQQQVEPAEDEPPPF